MVESLPPDADPLAQPKRIYDPASYDLHPDSSEGDRWIVEESRGDEILLLLIRSKEELGRLHSTGNEGSDYFDRMSSLGADIIRRQTILDRMDARP